MNYNIGIEGGGTKSTALLASSDGKILVHLSGASTNPNVIGFNKSALVISQLITGCCKKSKLSLRQISSIVVGTAGAGNITNQERLQKEMQKCFKGTPSIPTITITNDADIAAEAALSNKSGIVIISGTGSILIGKHYETRFPEKKPKIFRVGGWGKILGDEGSGYAIARDALRGVVTAFDKKKTSVLTRSALRYFATKHVGELPSIIANEKTEVASFAQVVIRLASKKDSESFYILEHHCNELLKQLHMMVQNFPRGKNLPVILLGGLLENNNFYSRMVKGKIRSGLPLLQIQKPKLPAVWGAIMLAQEH